MHNFSGNVTRQAIAKHLRVLVDAGRGLDAIADQGNLALARLEALVER